MGTSTASQAQNPASTVDEVTAQAFKALFRQHPAGVALITADAGFGPVALTASSVTSVSADPPLVLFSLSALSSSAPAIRSADTVVVHLLSYENLDLARLGARRGGDRFADSSRWSRLVTGEPVFPEVKSWLRGRIMHRIDAGGSTVMVAEALQTASLDATDDDGLVYADRTWHQIGDRSRVWTE